MKKGIAALIGAAVAASALITACGVSSSVKDYLFADEEDYTAYEEETVEFEKDAAFTLDLDWVAGEVVVRKGGDRITVTEEIIKGTYAPLYYTVKDGTLYVKFCKSGTLSKALLGCSKKITVTLPDGMKEIKISSVSAKSGIEYDGELDAVKVNSVTAGNGDKSLVDTVSGGVKISADAVDTVTCNAVSGDAEIAAASAAEAVAHSVSGDIGITVGGDGLKTVKVDTISGKTSITLDSGRAVSVGFNTVSGKLTNGIGEDGEGETKIEVKVDSVSGDLTVSRAKE